MVDKQKCACDDCVCTVSEGRAYCGDACANGHEDGSGCGHKGCMCHG